VFREIGIKFGLKGFDSSKAQLQQFGQAFQQMSSQVSSSAPGITGKLDSIAAHTKRMSKTIVSSMNLAKVAFTTFLAGRALSGIANMLSGSTEQGQGLYEDFLRASGFDPKQLTKHMMEMRGRIPNLPRTEYISGAYDTQSVLGGGGPEMVKKGLESTMYLWKSLGPEASRQQASDLIRGIAGAWGVGKAPGEVLKMIQQFEATIPPILKDTGIRGNELAHAMSQIISIYKEKGMSLQEMVADTAMIGGVMRERTGEVLRNIQARLVEGTSELAAKVGLEIQLMRRGVRRIEDLPEKEARMLTDSLKVTENEMARELTLVEKKFGPKGVMKVLDQVYKKGMALAETTGFPMQKELKSSFGETAPQGLPILLQGYTSGKRDELLAQQQSLESQRKNREKSWQSYEARYSMFEQRINNLKQSAFSGFKAVLADIYTSYGKSLEGVTQTWLENTEAVTTNLRAMLGSFKEGFQAVFGGEIPDLIKNLSEAMLGIVKMPTEELEGIGHDIGASLGGAFKSIYDSLVPVNTELTRMIPTLQQILETVNALLSPVRWLISLSEGGGLFGIPGWLGRKSAELLNDPKAVSQKQQEFWRLQQEMKQTRAASQKQQESWSLPQEMKQTNAARQEENISAPKPHFEDRPPMEVPLGGEKSIWDRVKKFLGTDKLTPDEQAANDVPEQNFNIACTVNIDGASLDGIVDAKVDKIMQDQRMGYGEFGFARPFMG